MHLIEILLPVVDRDQFRRVSTWLADRLTETFGGMTSFLRSPGEGLWDDGGKTVRDDIAVIEVMTEYVDHAWWAELRRELEERLQQKEIVIRAQTIERL